MPKQTGAAALTFEDYVALRRRGEYLPRLPQGTCPLCGAPFDVSWRGLRRSVCEACSPKLRRWTQSVCNAARYEKKKVRTEPVSQPSPCNEYARQQQNDPQDAPWTVTASPPGGCHIRCKGTQDDPWTVETLDGYHYEASENTGF